MALIITGHQRSGTTLLSRLCSVHPEMSMTNEFGNFLRIGQPHPVYTRRLLKRWGGIALRWWPLDETFGRPGPRRTVVRQNNRFIYKYLSSLRARKGQVISAAVIDEIMGEVLPTTSVVGDKYPEYIFSLDELVGDDDLCRMVIYRDCRDVTSSTLIRARTDWRRMPIFVRRLNTAEKIAHRWVRAIEMMEKHRDQLFIVRYEDLVTEVTGPMRKLAEWLGVDPAGFEVDRISARSIGKYRQGLTQEEVATVMEIAGPTMSRLGYV